MRECVAGRVSGSERTRGRARQHREVMRKRNKGLGRESNTPLGLGTRAHAHGVMLSSRLSNPALVSNRRLLHCLSRESGSSAMPSFLLIAMPSFLYVSWPINRIRGREEQEERKQHETAAPEVCRSSGPHDRSAHVTRCYP